MTSLGGWVSRPIGDDSWCHTYDERFADPKAGRPASAPRLPKAEMPSFAKGNGIPGAPEPLPDAMTHDAAKQQLHIGQGIIDHVTPAMWDYDVSGMNVLKQWFSYRKRDRSRPIIGDRRAPSPLSLIQPHHWPAEYTSDLLDLLNVLGRLVALEPKQAALLDDILAGKLAKRDAFSTLAAPPVSGAIDAPTVKPVETIETRW